MPHFVSACCKGELCNVCKRPATHKVAEEVPSDEPTPEYAGEPIKVTRHGLSAYVCCHHFKHIMGRAAPCEVYPKLSQLLMYLALDNSLTMKSQPDWPAESVEIQKELFNCGISNDEMEELARGEEKEIDLIVRKYSLEKTNEYLSKAVDGEYRLKLFEE